MGQAHSPDIGFLSTYTDKTCAVDNAPPGAPEGKETDGLRICA